MRKEKEIISQLIQWAANNKNIRVMLQTSSRTNPGAFVDLLSDYDIELIVSDLRPFLKSNKWIETFGPILVQWPLQPMVHHNWISRLVLYTDGTKIDFQISTKESMQKIIRAPKLVIDYDIGYKILLDKDNLTENLKPPTHTAYFIKKPTKKAYDEIVNDFWWNSTYVAKSLWRDELFFAKHMALHENLQKMLEWFIGLQHNWKVNTGNKGRWLKRYLDHKTWTEVKATFAGARLEDNWNAFFSMTRLFTRLAIEIGNALKYKYPTGLDKKMTEYLSKVRKLDKNADDLIL